MRFFRALVVVIAAATGATPTAFATNITTYHYDNLRTGWNSAETTLTPSLVAGGQFGLLHQVALDEQVDAQPLFVAGVSIGGALHDVVYVATNNDTIYAIDANSGAVLLSHHYGTPVPPSILPGACGGDSPQLGIASTPVIDMAAGTLYAITYTYENQVPVYRLHAIDLTNLQDKMPPVAASGTAKLQGGKKIAFNAANNRLRAGLVLAAGNIYAGFASWCDINNSVSRGWMLGWNAASLAPMKAGALIDRRAASTNTYFLSEIWMSGYGIASDELGSLYFVTGNSDPSGDSYNRVTNLAESVVKLSTNLGIVQDYFTPSGGANGWQNLDRSDGDFGSGGVMLLPPQPGSSARLAVTAGKAGPLYLLNRDHLGGVGDGVHNTLGTYTSGGCWCGPSYFMGADGVGRVVESSGQNVIVWRVASTPKPHLVQESVSPGLGNIQDPGFFTSVSSNGLQAGSAVIWAMEHPSVEGTDDIRLKAFDPANGSALLFSGLAGTWPHLGEFNAAVVPVVANGHVFVASYENLSIFGSTAGAAKAVNFQRPPRPALPPIAGVRHAVRGTALAAHGDLLKLRLRDGRVLNVDVAAARAAGHAVAPQAGHAFLVLGDYKDAVFVATYVQHQKDNKATWLPDQ